MCPVNVQNIKAELDHKRDVLTSMEGELSKACHWNGQVAGAFHRCDMMLSKYTEQVGLLSDRWRRILTQIDIRYRYHCLILILYYGCSRLNYGNRHWIGQIMDSVNCSRLTYLVTVSKPSYL